MALGIIIAVLMILVFSVVILGIGSDSIDKLFKTIAERQESQNDQAPAELQDVGNFAKDIGARVCNLRVDFIGIVSTADAYGFNILGDDIFIYMGDHGTLIEILSQLTQDKSIIKYRWFCQDEPSSLSWNFQKLSLSSLSFLDEFDGEVVRMKFEATSKDSGKNLFDTTGKVQFQAKQILPFGSTGTTNLDVTIFLEDVTEDDYDVRFWSDTSRVGVGGPTKDFGHKFSFDLCVPGKDRC